MINERATYLAMIRNSVGSAMFRTLIVCAGRHERDVLRNGTLSCAVFVSSLLFLMKSIGDVHATVAGTVADLERSGWKRIRTPHAGCVLLWEPIRYADGSMHAHLGFSVGQGRAISNSAARRAPVRHHWTYGRKNGKPRRRVTAVFVHPALA